MKEFIKDNFFEIITIILIFVAIFEVSKSIDTNSKERMAIINTTKENVKK